MEEQIPTPEITALLEGMVSWLFCRMNDLPRKNIYIMAILTFIGFIGVLIGALIAVNIPKIFLQAYIDVTTILAGAAFF